MLKGMLLGMAALVAVPTIATAQDFEAFRPGDWELTLAGSGSNGSDFNGTAIGINGSLGYFFNENVELSVRQSLSYTDLGAVDGSSIDGSTRVALDYHFDLGRWQPYIGANIGYTYGDLTNDTFIAGPEGGVKYFVNDTTFVQLAVEYQFFFDQGDDVSDAFSDGQFVYSLGLGFRF